MWSSLVHSRGSCKDQVNKNIETEPEFVGFFPKPSAIKASGGKLIFNNPIVADVKVLDDVIEDREEKEEELVEKPQSKVSSLVDLYRGLFGEEMSVNLSRKDNGTFGLEIVG